MKAFRTTLGTIAGIVLGAGGGKVFNDLVDDSGWTPIIIGALTVAGLWLIFDACVLERFVMGKGKRNRKDRNQTLEPDLSPKPLKEGRGLIEINNLRARGNGLGGFNFGAGTNTDVRIDNASSNFNRGVGFNFDTDADTDVRINNTEAHFNHGTGFNFGPPADHEDQPS
jgi:hypothetical protein